MARVYVVVEGQTEEAFVKNVLAQALWPLPVYLTPIILGRPGHKGGRTTYARLKRDVLVLLKQGQAASCSTMLDFYGLGGGFPGMPLPPTVPSLDKVIRIEEAVKADIVAEVPGLRPDIRFVPYLQLHEYEGLLFSDPVAFATGIGQPRLAQQFERIRSGFPTPEDINDGPNTAPSKRVLGVHAAYQKVVDGTLGAQAVGVARMRQGCPHFRNWVEQLQALAANIN